jgi:hypothetical protein
MSRIVFLLTGLLFVTGCVPVTTTYYAEAPIVTTGYVYRPYYYQPYYYHRPYYNRPAYRPYYNRPQPHYYR